MLTHFPPSLQVPTHGFQVIHSHSLTVPHFYSLIKFGLRGFSDYLFYILLPNFPHLVKCPRHLSSCSTKTQGTFLASFLHIQYIQTHQILLVLPQNVSQIHGVLFISITTTLKNKQNPPTFTPKDLFST